MSAPSPGVTLALAALVAAGVAGQGPGFREPLDHPAIQYLSAPTTDAVADLNRRLATGAARLPYDPDRGYLPAVLDALKLPKESQLAVFSPTSFQASLINARNPRVIFFNDSVSVGWVRGGLLEVAAQDPRLGPIFYHLEQRPAERPRFEREDAECLECHRTWETLAVPGLLVLTTFPPTTPNGYASGGVTDHRSPFDGRWAGWYVTGRPGRTRHMGNKPVPTLGDTSPTVTLDSLDGRFDLTGYPTPYSDIVALMVFDHQTRMTNLLTYLAWQARVNEAERRAPSELASIVTDVADYMLFVDEAPLAGRVEGTSGFAAMFEGLGPRDSRGRSLRHLDLERRLMRYPLSYMIYSPAFDALPRAAKDALFRRLWDILSGQDTRAPYTRLTPEDREAVVAILRDTKPDLPAYFQSR